MIIIIDIFMQIIGCITTLMYDNTYVYMYIIIISSWIKISTNVASQYIYIEYMITVYTISFYFALSPFENFALN